MKIEVDTIEPEIINNGKSDAILETNNWILSNSSEYANNNVGGLPDWLNTALSNAIADGSTDLNGAIESLNMALNAIEVGVHQQMTRLQNDLESQSGLLTTVKAELNGNMAGVIQQVNTRVTKEGAESTVNEMVGSKWLNGNESEAESYIVNQAKTVANDTLAESTVVQDLYSTITDTASGNTALVANREQFYTSAGIASKSGWYNDGDTNRETVYDEEQDAIDAGPSDTATLVPAGELTGSTGYLNEMVVEVGDLDLRMNTEEGLSAGKPIKITSEQYNDDTFVKRIGMYREDEDANFWQYAGGSAGRNKDGWFFLGEREPTADNWIGTASKIIESPTGKKTGYTFTDSSDGEHSTFNIYADNFKLTNGTLNKTPFTMNTLTDTLSLGGDVVFYDEELRNYETSNMVIPDLDLSFNMLINADFYDHSIDTAFGITADSDTLLDAHNDPEITLYAKHYSNTIEVSQDSQTNEDGYYNLQLLNSLGKVLTSTTLGFPVIAGEKYAASCYINVTRCTSRIALITYDADGNSLKEAYSKYEDDGDQLHGTAIIIPENAVYLRMFIQKSDSNEDAYSKIRAHNPMLAQVSVDSNHGEENDNPISYKDPILVSNKINDSVIDPVGILTSLVLLGSIPDKHAIILSSIVTRMYNESKYLINTISSYTKDTYTNPAESLVSLVRDAINSSENKVINLDSEELLRMSTSYFRERDTLYRALDSADKILENGRIEYRSISKKTRDDTTWLLMNLYEALEEEDTNNDGEGDGTYSLSSDNSTLLHNLYISTVKPLFDRLALIAERVGPGDYDKYTPAYALFEERVVSLFDGEDHTGLIKCENDNTDSICHHFNEFTKWWLEEDDFFNFPQYFYNMWRYHSFSICSNRKLSLVPASANLLSESRTLIHGGQIATNSIKASNIDTTDLHVQNVSDGTSDSPFVISAEGKAGTSGDMHIYGSRIEGGYIKGAYIEAAVLKHAIVISGDSRNATSWNAYDVLFKDKSQEAILTWLTLNNPVYFMREVGEMDVESPFMPGYILETKHSGGSYGNPSNSSIISETNTNYADAVKNITPPGLQYSAASYKVNTFNRVNTPTPMFTVRNESLNSAYTEIGKDVLPNFNVLTSTTIIQDALDSKHFRYDYSILEHFKVHFFGAYISVKLSTYGDGDDKRYNIRAYINISGTHTFSTSIDFTEQDDYNSYSFNVLGVDCAVVIYSGYKVRKKHSKCALGVCYDAYYTEKYKYRIMFGVVGNGGDETTFSVSDWIHPSRKFFEIEVNDDEVQYLDGFSTRVREAFMPAYSFFS